MALRAQISALLVDLLAIGIVRNDATDAALLYAPDGSLIEALVPDAVQAATPVTGATVVMTDNATGGLLYLTPAGTLATLTINLPSNAKSRIGQIERVFTTQAITALTLGQVGGGATIVNAPTTLAANGAALFQKVAANTWLRVM